MDIQNLRLGELQKHLDSLDPNSIEWDTVARRMTDLLALASRALESRPLFQNVTVGNQTVMLDSFEIEEVEGKLSEARLKVASCQNHKRDRCDCWEPTRRYIWHLQETRPGTPRTLACELLWNAVEDYARIYERPRTTNTVEEQLVRLTDELQAARERDNTPSWQGRRGR